MLTGRISSPEPNDLVHDMMFDTGVYNMFQAPNTPGRVNFIMIHIIFHRPIYQILKKKTFCDPSTIHHLPSRIPSDPSLVTINSPAFTGRVSPQHWLKHPQCLLPLRQHQRLLLSLPHPWFSGVSCSAISSRAGAPHVTTYNLPPFRQVEGLDGEAKRCFSWGQMVLWFVGEAEGFQGATYHTPIWSYDGWNENKSSHRSNHKLTIDWRYTLSPKKNPSIESNISWVLQGIPEAKSTSFV